MKPRTVHFLNLIDYATAKKTLRGAQVWGKTYAPIKKIVIDYGKHFKNNLIKG